MPNNNEIDMNKPFRRGMAVISALLAFVLGAGTGFYVTQDPDVDINYIRTQINTQMIEQKPVAKEVDGGGSVQGQLNKPRKLAEAFAEPAVYDSYQWIIDKSRSTLSFEALQYGQKFGGSFDFDGKIIFNPDDLESALVSIKIDIASIATGSLTRDEQARTPDWFDVKSHPFARFEAARFVKGEEDDAYVAHGVLNIRGVDVPIELPFQLTFVESEKNGEIASVQPELEGDSIGVGQREKESAKDDSLLKADKNKLAKNSVEMISQISLRRSELGVGVGDWGNEDVISDNVDIYIVLHASKAKQP